MMLQEMVALTRRMQMRGLNCVILIISVMPAGVFAIKVNQHLI